VLHAYAEWGDACLERLEGMFAFALWDERRGRLLAARDRVGIKPLYHARTGRGLLIASELSALLELLPGGAEPDPAALAQVMTLGYVPAPGSIWRDVQKLEPGHALCFEPEGEPLIRRWWQPPADLADPLDESREAAEWEWLCEEVLRAHLLSDVPIGLFLSGGLDSSAIAAGIAELGCTATALSVDLAGGEIALAARTAARLGLRHEKLALAAGDVRGLAERAAVVFDEPQSYSALLSMLRICEAAGGSFKVVLAGDGGDEIFGGYRWYRDLAPAPGAGRSAGALRRLLGRRGSPRLRRLAARVFAARSPLHRHAWRVHPRFLPEEAEAILAPTDLRFDDERMLAPLARHFEPRLPLLRALQRVDLMSFCADSILPKVDRASMAHSLEVRVPWLDRRVIEWGLRRPLGAREPGKRVLRRYLAGRVPEGVLEQPKRGFSVRVLDGFDLERAVREIEAGPWVRRGWWAPDWAQAIRPGVPQRGARIWNLWALTRWAERWWPERAGDAP
jgi:asparagine synthase (glutamine-hydrolysing)